MGNCFLCICVPNRVQPKKMHRYGSYPIFLQRSPKLLSNCSCEIACFSRKVRSSSFWFKKSCFLFSSLDRSLHCFSSVFPMLNTQLVIEIFISRNRPFFNPLCDLNLKISLIQIKHKPTLFRVFIMFINLFIRILP